MLGKCLPDVVGKYILNVRKNEGQGERVFYVNCACIKVISLQVTERQGYYGFFREDW